MRWITWGMGIGSILLTLVGGCAWSESNQVRPPKPAEEFRAPPESEARYSRPLEYPKETMEQDYLLKKAKDAAKGAPNPMRSGGMTSPGGRAGF